MYSSISVDRAWTETPTRCLSLSRGTVDCGEGRAETQQQQHGALLCVHTTSASL